MKVNLFTIYDRKNVSEDSFFKVHVETNINPDTMDEEIEKEIHSLSDKIMFQLERNFYKKHIKTKNRKKEFETLVTRVFKELKLIPIHIKEIPNGFLPEDPVYEFLPWLEISTRIGVLILGIRQKVIVLDWSKSDITENAKTIFPLEVVVKNGYRIDAWSEENLKQYISILMDHSKNLTPGTIK